MQIIPAIDLKNGNCVRLRQGKMDDVTVFSDDPVQVASNWINAGCRRLHLVDLDGAFIGRPNNTATIRDIAKSFPNTPLQVGGGIRTFSTIEKYLDAGISQVILGTLAVKDPEFIHEACRKFPDSIIVGIDAKGGMVATDGWENVTEMQAAGLAHDFANCGVTAIVYTDIARDGMMQGCNVVETLNLAKVSKIPIIASGGIRNIADIKILIDAAEPMLVGAIVGRALYEGDFDLAAAQSLCDANLEL